MKHSKENTHLTCPQTPLTSRSKRSAARGSPIATLESITYLAGKDYFDVKDVFSYLHLTGTFLKKLTSYLTKHCLGFGWDRVNFPPSSCCVLDLVGENLDNTDGFSCCYEIKDFFQSLIFF